MSPSPEQPLLPETKKEASADQPVEIRFRDKRNALVQSIYEQKNSADAPTDKDWEDIFENLKKGHEELLSDLEIESWSDLQEFALNRDVIRDLYRDLRDEVLTEEEMEDLVKNQPAILTEACMKLSFIEVRETSRSTHKSLVPYISRLPEASSIMAEIGKEEDVYSIEYYADEIQPYCFTMLQASIESGKEPFYQDDLHSLLEGLATKDIALKDTEVEWLRLHALQDDSPDTHQSRLTYTGGSSSDRLSTDFFAEPALQGMMQVKEEWVDLSLFGREATPEIKTQARAMIARNLFFRQQPITEESVRAEWLRIIHAREEYRDQPIFQGRNVLVLAHHEKLNDHDFDPNVHGEDHARFGHDELMDVIKKQQGDGVPSAERVRPESESDEDIRDAKKNALLRIKTLPPPATFYFDMHGSSEAVYFSDGQVTQNGVADGQEFVKITSEELAECFQERAKKFGAVLSTKEGRDIIVSQACFSNNFFRDFYQKLGSLPKPLALGATEYNVEALSALYDEKLGSKFTAKILDLDGTHDGSVTTFGDVFDNELRGLEDSEIQGTSLRTNPTFFSPDEENEVMQVTKNDKEKSGDEGSRVS